MRGQSTVTPATVNLESKMLDIHAANPHASHVIALYPDGWEFFDLPAGATLIDLASRLDALADTHHGIAVEVKMHFEASQPDQGTSFSPPHSALN